MKDVLIASNEMDGVLIFSKKDFQQSLTVEELKNILSSMGFKNEVHEGIADDVIAYFAFPLKHILNKT